MSLGSDVMNFWESIGVFALILPFILVFAIFYGLLTKIKLFEDNKGVNVTISLTMALTATILGYYGDCLSSLVIGGVVAITSTLVFFIFTTIFLKDVKERKYLNHIAAIIATITFIITVIQINRCDLSYLDDFWKYLFLIPIAIVIGLILWVIFGKGKSKAPLDSERRPGGRGPRRGRGPGRERPDRDQMMIKVGMALLTMIYTVHLKPFYS